MGDAQKLPIKFFEWIEETQFTQDFIKNYNEESDEGYFLEADVQYPEKIHDDLLFLPARIKIEKVEKPVTNLYDKKWICHSHKKVLNHGSNLKKFERVIKFNQNDWLKKTLY